MSNNTHNPHLVYRPDIDGLRAVAILLVIIFHAFPKFLRGGFIGVDIFFVISGYLITTIILKGQSQNSFSLVEFYSRRIKRIFPSLIVVLSFCLVSGWFILLANEYEGLGKHIAAGSVYLSNFILQSESGYFDTAAELKPLLHLWSLSIEEQFYLFFPVLLIIANRLNVSSLLTILTCLVISFSLNVIQISNDPTEVFFFPYTRAWELLVGSLVSCFNLHFRKIENDTVKLANLLSGLGVMLIVAAWVGLDSKKILFPSWWALLPTLGAACLILAGEKAWFNKYILASKIAIYIGLISYPLYLWHWVLLSFARITEIDKPNVTLRLALVLTSMLLAWLTYHFVEKKIRFQKSKFMSLGLLSCLLFIGAMGYLVKQENGYPARYSLDANWSSGEIGNDVFRNSGLISQKKCVDKYSKIPYEKFPNDEFCLVQDVEKVPTALLLGDSHANQLYLGLTTQTNLTGGNLLNLGAGGCFPFFDNPMNPNKKCRQLIDQSLEMAMATPSIETVILSSRAITEINEKSFTQHSSLDLKTESENNPYTVFEKGMRKTLQRLLDAKKNVVFILDIPELEFEPIVCVNRPWRLSGQLAKTPCAILRSQVNQRRQKYFSIVSQVLSEFPRVNVLDPLPALCDSNYCWAIKDQKMLYRDNNHLNEVGASYLGEHLFLTK